ncbi:MAG: L-histidine N(alpha)-methyltransferase [Planctomycetota bacterium]
MLEGLTAEEKFLPAKLHYDHRGSELFERICSVEEYYITRTELGIMKDSSEEIAESIGSGAMLIEPGSGASLKTRLLLDALDSPAAYVPVDISRDFLLEAAEEIARRHEVEVLPVWADFTKAHPLPEADGEVEGRAIYTSGDVGGSVIVGFDQKKEIGRMEAAYNDAEGVTAEFNYNVLDRLGRELEADLDRDKFTFRAEWDEEVGAIVSRLRAREAHEVEVAGRTIVFESGEPIRMEESHKYTREEFEALAGQVGLGLDRVWSDPADDFAVARLV